MTISLDQEVQSCMPFLRNFARKLTRDENAAADLTQETVFKVLESRERFDTSRNFKAWATTIMRNLFINEHRRKIRHATAAFDPLQMVVLENYLGTAENEAIAGLQLQMLHRFVNELDDALKNPFVLYLHGFKYEEIAELLDAEVNTLRGRIFQARKLLQQRIVGTHLPL